MITQEQMHQAIDESYDALALIQTAVRALGDIELKICAPYNQALCDIQRALLVSYKKSEIAHDALEHIDLEGFQFEGGASHG